MLKALRLVPLLVPLLLLLPMGCGQAGAPSVSRTITGTCLFTFWLDDGSTTTRPGCNDTAISAFGHTSSGGWTQVSSTAMTASGFSVGAPAGDYLLGVKYPIYLYWEFFETAADGFALGANVVGRSDNLGASSETIATFNLDGLDSWNANDYVELTSSGGSTFEALLYPSDGTSLQAGTTSGLASFDWYGSSSSLPDGTQGDVVYLHQDATLSIPGTGLSYQAATRFAQLPATFAVADGTTQVLDVTFSAVPQTGSLSVDWRISAFEQYSADINPYATGVEHSLHIDANPHTLSDRPQLEPGNPQMVFLTLPPGTSDQTFAGLPYGQFFAAVLGGVPPHVLYRRTRGNSPGQRFGSQFWRQHRSLRPTSSVGWARDTAGDTTTVAPNRRGRRLSESGRRWDHSDSDLVAACRWNTDELHH